MSSSEHGLDSRRVSQVKPRPKDFISREEYSFNVRVRAPLERVVGVAEAERIIRAVHDFQSAWGKGQQAAWESRDKNA